MTPRCAEVDAPLATDERHRHFGGGEMRTTLDLSAGEHSLQLLFADLTRLAHGTPLASEPIAVTAWADDPAAECAGGRAQRPRSTRDRSGSSPSMAVVIAARRRVSSPIMVEIGRAHV